MINKQVMPIILLCCFLAATVAAQTESPDCQQQLISYFSKSSLIGKPAAGKAYYMDLQIKNVMKDSLSKPTSYSNVKITISNTHYFYRSTEMDMYKDETSLFVIIHGSRSVFWSLSKDNGSSEKAWNVAFSLRDSLVKESKVVKCKELAADKTNAHALKEVVLEIPAKRQVQTKVKQMEFILDTEKECITRSVVSFNDKNLIARTVTTFNEINLDYKEEHPEKKVEEMLIGKQGELIGAYKGYKLIDKRRKTSNN
jgi:hypothetical protein